MAVNNTSLRKKTDPAGHLTEDKEVVLTWPGKDSLLENGDAGNKTFPNEALLHGEIDRLINKKAFTAFELHTINGTEKVGDFSPSDNFIIKGDNLIVLYSLKDLFVNKVKLVYIDPPYNTGKKGFNYKDALDHAAWLTFMRRRLAI